MRFPIKDTVLLNIYRCGQCDGRFISQDSNYRVSCAVMHAPGTCCHYGEQEVQWEQFVNVMKAVERQP